MGRGAKGPGPAKGQGGRPAKRALHVRVRTAKGRTLSSQRWLERQLNDPYVAAARREGYRSRAAYKLIEIDVRHGLLRPGQRVIDLGAAPGGWSQVAAAKVTAGKAGGGQVIAVDMSEMDAIPGVTIVKLDLLAQEAPAQIIAALGGAKADAVLSDMAAPATGHRQTDHLRIMALAEAAAELAAQVLAPGGSFLCKVLQGGTERTLLERLKRDFAAVRHVKPKASRSDSAELYVLATGFRGVAE